MVLSPQPETGNGDNPDNLNRFEDEILELHLFCVRRLTGKEGLG
jgi:hypothetical protein